jgi:predicted MPP superfamily phosphohydrolase
MNFSKINRRRFLLAALLMSPWAVYADAWWVEPVWLKVRRLRLTKDKPTHRLVHFTDLHHKGDRGYAQSVVKTINSLSPDFICFTGDLIEEVKFLPEALEILSGVKSPMYGVPGNHDYWSRSPFGEIRKCFASTGGAWLEDEQQVTADGKVNIVSLARLGQNHPLPSPNSGMKNILLMHYPAWVKGLDGRKFDLTLAGHSHGGQVRIPFFGPVMVPYGVDEYDLGLFQTNAGPLYVNPGIGWFPLPIRFHCRPEITAIEV